MTLFLYNSIYTWIPHWSSQLSSVLPLSSQTYCMVNGKVPYNWVARYFSCGFYQRLPSCQLSTDFAGLIPQILNAINAWNNSLSMHGSLGPGLLSMCAYRMPHIQLIWENIFQSESHLKFWTVIRMNSMIF